MSYSAAAPAEVIVRLNVGGTRFETTASTLRGRALTRTKLEAGVAPTSPYHASRDSKQDNFFCALLDDSHAMTTLKDEDGAFFIDRDPNLFAAVLSFLRTGRVDPSAFGVSEDALRSEAEFYCVELPVATEHLVQLHEHGMYFGCGVENDLTSAQRLVYVQKSHPRGGEGKYAERVNGAWTWHDVVFEFVGSTIVRVMRAPRHRRHITRTADNHDENENNNNNIGHGALGSHEGLSTDDEEEEGEDEHENQEVEHLHHQHVPHPPAEGDNNNNPAATKRKTRRTLFTAVITPTQLVVVSPSAREWGTDSDADADSAGVLKFFPSNEPTVGTSFRAREALNNSGHANSATIISFPAHDVASVVLVNYRGRVTVARTAPVILARGATSLRDYPNMSPADAADAPAAGGGVESEVGGQVRGDAEDLHNDTCGVASHMVAVLDPLFRSRFPSRFLCFGDVMIEFVKYPAPLQAHRDRGRLYISEQLMFYKLVC